MKNLMFIILTFTLCAGVFAQTTQTTKTTKTETQKTETKPAPKATSYCCPKCDYCSEQAGTCPHHKISLEVSETKVMYCCGHCDWTIPPVKGECHHSTLSLYKDGVLNCVFCSNKGGKCPNCGMQMGKIIVKKKKSKG